MKKFITVMLVCLICLCSVNSIAFAEEVTSAESEVLRTSTHDMNIEEQTEVLVTSGVIETPELEPIVTDSLVSMKEGVMAPSEPDLGVNTPIPVGAIESSENTVEFFATITPTIIDVTIPLNVDVYINPNEDDGFLYGAIEVQNHTKAPVVVSVKDFQTCNIPFRTCIAPYELPSNLSWDNMSVTQTQQYFSLGIKPITFNNKVWAEEYTHDYVYARDNFIPTQLGVISGQQTAYLGLRSYYGKAFTEEKRFQFSATFVVELQQ